MAVIADMQGHVVAHGRGGNGNWQGPGVERARQEVLRSIEAALGKAGIATTEIKAAYFGMAGADRAADFEKVRQVLNPIAPWPRWAFENDATIALRAAAPDGVGIAAICGSGTNVVGFNDAGEKVQIGGFGFEFGDSAGAAHIGVMAMRHAWRAMEGRGPATSLVQGLKAHLGLNDLMDVLDGYYTDRPIVWWELAPLVFAAAEDGDKVAQGILVEVGEELALAVNVAWDKLFNGQRAIPVVAGGSVFQRPQYPLLLDTFTGRVQREHPNARVIRLQTAPVLGAVFAALDLLGHSVTPELAQAYQQSWLALASSNEGGSL
jgi:N-acetylglucosamine kinase-like BadF-type ATPase